MKRMLLVLTVALVMAAMLAVTASAAFALGDPFPGPGRQCPLKERPQASGGLLVVNLAAYQSGRRLSPDNHRRPVAWDPVVLDMELGKMTPVALRG